MRPDVSQGALTKEQRRAGLYLDEPDDHTLLLKSGNVILARWTPHVTVKAIQAEAQKVLGAIKKENAEVN